MILKLVQRLTLGVLLLLFGAQMPSWPADPQRPSTAPVPATRIWSDLMAGNRRFVAGQPQSRDYINRRKALATTQSPKVIVLACSDSRVAPELLFDQNLGDLFVVRAAGNIADAIGVGSIEYAVEHLGSTVLVVLGHTNCGAVAAACSGNKSPTPDLEVIGKRIGPACTKAPPRHAGIDLSIEANVRKSADDVLQSSELLREAVRSGKLMIMRAVYRVDTGEVVRLD